MSVRIRGHMEEILIFLKWLVYACLEVEELGEALRWVRSHPPKPFRSNTEAFLASLDQFLGAL